MKHFFISFAFLLSASFSFAQTDSAQLAYIQNYGRLAVIEMYKSQIPASITMAQALVESASGTSALAIEARNHFGIKCKTNYKGKVFLYDDDKPNECFRVYETVEESYRDHSTFLVESPRYSDLFELELSDYTSWAYGLKSAGYATNPRYPQILLNIIQRYNLHHLDDGVEKWQYEWNKHSYESDSLHSIEYETLSDTGMMETEVVFIDSSMYVQGVNTDSRYQLPNGSEFIYTRNGDTWKSVSERHDVWITEFKKYNERSDDPIFEDLEKLFVRPKKNKAVQKKYVAVGGETLYHVSQAYGVKVEKLERYNDMERNKVLKKGEKVNLR